MTQILLSWLGNREIGGHDATYGASEVAEYLRCLQNDFKHVIMSVSPPVVKNPWDYSEIYEETTQAIESIISKYGKSCQLTLHLGPGTSAMTAVWIILSKTRYVASLVRTESENSVLPVDIPFDISAEFYRSRDKAIERLQAPHDVDTTEFSNIIFKSEAMRIAVDKASRYAKYLNLPILLEGESGVGKELFAKAIHNSSSRAGKPYKKVNCGSIPKDLIESELFGHIKGSFSGAIKDKIGMFEAANGGTLFLDEIGELPLYAQVKLLAVIQDNEITKIGATEPKKIDVRIISATNRELQKEVGAKMFRLDLFHRIAGGVVTIPPLYKREGDINLLAEYFLQKIGTEFNCTLQISPQAMNYMLSYNWPGNVRELEYTL
ncbi:MAG: sigma 54-interacting transcriptional regulator, partial [Chlorobium sp.]|nr:sigma 54-interacting transcriptional regulator [Chlorobium sp.]